VIPRNRWPEALMAFLADHSTVTIEDIAYGALRSPGGYHPDESAPPLATGGQGRSLAQAGEGVISNGAHGHHLPSSWDSLYQLSRLDEGTLTAAD
jgi:hypothetical protein